MAVNQSDPSIYYRYFYNRSTVVQERKRLKERKRLRKRIIRQRAVAYDLHGCEQMAECCTFPECWCYPYWKKKYRALIEHKIVIAGEEDENENIG